MYSILMISNNFDNGDKFESDIWNFFNESLYSKIHLLFQTLEMVEKTTEAIR